jgi:single-stranded DNA-binding protein
MLPACRADLRVWFRSFLADIISKAEKDNKNKRLGMQFFNSVEENEIRVTGVLMNPPKVFEHQGGVVTLKISAKSYSKTFHDSVRSSRREHIMVELHDEAAKKAMSYQPGDILLVKGQLGVRDWIDVNQKRHIRVVAVVHFPREINKIGESKFPTNESVNSD